MIEAQQFELFGHMQRMADLAQARIKRDEQMSQVEQNAGERFRTAARAFVLRYLRELGPATGEDLTDACIAHGIEPHDERAMGPVLMALSRSGQIEKAGFAARRKGHGCSGANIWRLSGR